jgi:hypothetical protein
MLLQLGVVPILSLEESTLLHLIMCEYDRVVKTNPVTVTRDEAVKAGIFDQDVMELNLMILKCLDFQTD